MSRAISYRLNRPLKVWPLFLDHSGIDHRSEDVQFRVDSRGGLGHEDADEVIFRIRPGVSSKGAGVAKCARWGQPSGWNRPSDDGPAHSISHFVVASRQLGRGDRHSAD